MKNTILKFIALVLFLAFTIGSCSIFEKEKDKNKDRNNLLILAALASRNTAASRDMYAGFADIPASIYKTSSTTSSSVQASSKTLATTDYKFQNSAGTSSVSSVYDLVRSTAKSTRDIAKTVGDLVSALESLPITVSSTAITGTGTWAEKASKHSYKSSTTLTGGKHLEVWWNNAAAPYSNNKAIEMNYTGSTASGNISGYLWARFLSSTSATTLSVAYIKFDYNASTNTRTMVVILQNIGTTFTDKAHFFVQEVNGVTTMDGAYTINNFNPNATGVAASNRVYVFNAAGDSSKAVVNAAFPRDLDATTAIYANTTLGNIGQVWTNWIFANATLATTIKAIGGSCASVNTTSDSGNPTAFGSNTTVAILKACLDAIITAQSGSTNSVKDVYFLTNIKNPAYFTFNGSTATLYGVESLETSDANKGAFDTLYAKLLTSTRATSNTTYAAGLDAATVSTINLFTGVGIPTGTTANTLPSINAQWGSGTLGTGISGSSTVINTINGSIDNTAPF